ncbi:MAG: FtsQ-type POTRA domain-containing protein [Actinomycetaceae bacterium]|nr:FtsQ-type POTRA domain-containing protein [Actinomycetaceae bacterium]
MRRPGVPRNPKPKPEPARKSRPEPKKNVRTRSSNTIRQTTEKPEQTESPPRQPEKAVTRVDVGGWRRYFTQGRATKTFGSRSQPNELEGRRNELRRAKSRAVWTRVLMALSTLVVTATLIWVVFFSPVFAFKTDHVSVNGTSEEVSAEEVIAHVRPWAGVPLPRLSMNQLAQRVEEIVIVHTAAVSREWPNGLTIDLTLRTPEYTQYRDGIWEILDLEGVEISTQEDKPTELAAIELTGDDELRAKAIDMISAVRGEIDPGLAEQIDTYVSDGHAVEMRTVNGPLIKWGDSSQSALKSQTVLVLLEQRPSHVYDVSTPTRPVTS